MTQTSQLVLARQQHPLEGRGSHDAPRDRRLVLLALAGLGLGLAVGLAIGLPWGIGAAGQMARDGTRAAPVTDDLATGDLAAGDPAAGDPVSGDQATGEPAAWATAPSGPGQGGEGIRCNGPATPGGTLEVEVGSNDDSVAVTNPVTGETTHHDVGPDKTAHVPVPQVPPGTVLRITVGRGASQRSVTVEVTAPAA